jgi:hypothetical protein
LEDLEKAKVAIRTDVRPHSVKSMVTFGVNSNVRLRSQKMANRLDAYHADFFFPPKIFLSFGTERGKITFVCMD